MASSKTYWVYILASRTRVLYIGVTGNLERRIAAHRRGDIPGFTAQYRVSRLVYVEQSSEALCAIAREKQLKGWRRSKKIALIEASNREWRDLAAGS